MRSECPAEAIFADTEAAATEFWLDLNAAYADQWPNIISSKAPLPDAEAHDGKAGKLEDFLAEPGKGE